MRIFIFIGRENLECLLLTKIFVEKTNSQTDEKTWELLAPGRPIRALASDGFVTTRFNSGNVSAVGSCCEAYWCCEQLFTCCEPSCFQHSTNDVASVLRACCERGYVQHPTSGVYLPSSPHVATMLRPVLRATSNIRISPPQHKSQHQMPATSKTQYPQH
jgi:hypothetical protein